MVETNGRNIRDRNVESESFAMLLNPEWHSMTFEPLMKKLDNCQRFMEDQENDINDRSQKLSFIKGLRDIIEKYIHENDPYNRALENFAKVLQLQCSKKISGFVEHVFKANFNRECINW